jgi:hypothetical protein
MDDATLKIFQDHTFAFWTKLMQTISDKFQHVKVPGQIHVMTVHSLC